MDDKQIFASVEVCDHEVRMVVGEFFSPRLNILKVEMIPCSGLSYNTINNADEIISAIETACKQTEQMLGAKLEKVILSIPSYQMQRKSVRVTVPVKGYDGVVSVQDIRNAMKLAERQVSIGKELALVQTVCVKYTIDGIASRRIPIGERAKELVVDIDLLCADRQLAYSLVGCIEKAGLQVMDIYLDTYAAAKEAALFEQSVDRNVVLLKMEREATTVARLSKGKLMESTIVPLGVGSIAARVVDEYGLKREEACELVKYSARLNEKVNSTNPVYIWSVNGNAKKITEAELCKCISPLVSKWVEDMQKILSGILQAGPSTVIITGEGGEMQGLNELLQSSLNCEVRNYIPETLGARNAGMTTCLGLFYAYKDKLPITGYTDNSLDMKAFMDSVSYRERKPNSEDTLTGKLKGMFSTSNKK
ncbi:MAG: cell division protein FtsA [Bulleidia sp.]|nr:cell division protein FtsA [Erysipelotrichaceae bacterium]MDY2780791.1 cell division protein FtsA [Bulleidia sp.]